MGLSADTAAVPIVRATGPWLITTATVLLVSNHGATYASAFSLAMCSVATAINLIIFDALGRERPSQVVGALVLGLLSRLTFTGRIGPLVAPAIQLVLGTLIYLTPVATAELYQLTTPMTALSHSMLASYGSSIALVGVYVGCLAKGLTQSQSLAALFLANAALGLKWAIRDAEDLGAPKLQAFATAAGFAVLGAMALK